MRVLSERSLVKARRLLDEGRVQEVTAMRTFVVDGDHGRYLVSVGPDTAICSCPAFRPCSHLEAARLAIRCGRSDARRPTGALAPAAAGVQPRTAGPRLFTWHWRAALDADRPDLTLVRISLGRPRWAPRERTAAIPYVGELAPAGGLFQIEDDAEFERRYRERLDGFGVERIERRFREVAAAHGGLSLALLCFERDRRECHRGTFAAWWQERTGVAVPEVR